jgi:hypothetical protein
MLLCMLTILWLWGSVSRKGLFSTYKKCKANCEVLKIHQTEHFRLWSFHFCEPITVCVCVYVRSSYCLINHERYRYIYIFLEILSEFARLTNLYVIAQSELFVLVVHCHSDVTYQTWSFVIPEIFKLVSSLLLLQKYIYYDFFFVCDLFPLWLHLFHCQKVFLYIYMCVCVCVYIYIYIFIYLSVLISTCWIICDSENFIVKIFEIFGWMVCLW